MKGAAAIILLWTYATTASAFQSPTAFQTIRQQHTRVSRSTITALPPLDAITDLVTSWSHHHDFAVLLADASSSMTADAATASSAADDSGWWAAYLNVFKTCLLFVHNTIDAPLRSVGLTQTWGPSIAIFTACKF
jgi:hypothetical protein